MGICFAYGNLDRKEYIDPASLDDNGKFPVHQTAHALHEAMRDTWSGDHIQLFCDSGDMPWDDYVSGHEAWTDVSQKYAPRILFFDTTPRSDDGRGIYVAGYVSDDRDMRYPRVVNGETVASLLTREIQGVVHRFLLP